MSELSNESTSGFLKHAKMKWDCQIVLHQTSGSWRGTLPEFRNVNGKDGDPIFEPIVNYLTRVMSKATILNPF
jgi:hypothetical protein